MTQISTNVQHAASIKDVSETSSMASVDNKTGKLDGQNVVVDTAANSVTNDDKTKDMIASMQHDIKAENVDDEKGSDIQAQKNADKAKNDEAKEAAQRQRANAMQGVKNTENVNEQQQHGKRITKQTEARLKIINQGTEEDLQKTIGERSNALFSGSEKEYEELFQEFDKLSLGTEFDTSKFQKVLQDKFPDIAEQHNALEIILNVWERKLTRLNTEINAEEYKARSEEDKEKADVNKQTQQNLKEYSQQLKANIDALKEVQTNLYDKNKDRIDDTYKLAPLLREVTANYKNEFVLQPKKLCELILDKVLPLKGDPVKTFDYLCEDLINNNKGKGFIDEKTRENAIACFANNIVIISGALKNELKSCSDASISSAILNVCRTIQNLEAAYRFNEEVALLTNTAYALTS